MFDVSIPRMLGALSYCFTSLSRLAVFSRDQNVKRKVKAAIGSGLQRRGMLRDTGVQLLRYQVLLGQSATLDITASRLLNTCEVTKESFGKGRWNTWTCWFTSLSIIAGSTSTKPQTRPLLLNSSKNSFYLS